MSIFPGSWARSWAEIGASGDGFGLRDQILAAYAEPHRRYHTLQHLEECLALFHEFRDEAEFPGEVEMALWFHDAVYDVRAHDNEERSAEFAASALAHAGISDNRVQRVRELILITRHTSLPKGKDQALIVDIDLAILGSAPERFDEYESQIREEYAWVPEDEFCPARLAILRLFLAREAIFATPELRSRFEMNARENIARSVARLSRSR